jgi:hypothetical protein
MERYGLAMILTPTKKKFFDNEGKEVVPGDFILYVTETKALAYKVFKIDMPYIHMISLVTGNHLVRLDHELDTCYIVTDKISLHYRGS